MGLGLPGPRLTPSHSPDSQRLEKASPGQGNPALTTEATGHVMSHYPGQLAPHTDSKGILTPCSQMGETEVSTGSPHLTGRRQLFMPKVPRGMALETGSSIPVPQTHLKASLPPGPSTNRN